MFNLRRRQQGPVSLSRPGQSQRGVSTPSAPSATAAAVDVRSTVGPSRTAVAPACGQRCDLVVG